MINKIDPSVKSAVQRLQEAGFDTYIVGGAVRDILLNRKPKDYDVSTMATPEEVRALFGRKRAMIIGKRFRLVHLREHNHIIEVSTFRRAPNGACAKIIRPQYAKPVDNPQMIRDDNEYGTPQEDAFRRDFTVNALFYDPVTNDILDFTHHGLSDLHQGIVRVIGDPVTRFEEDPVRLLRALKLVGQYNFKLEAETAKALYNNLSLITLASPSRLTLELEKILRSQYGHKILRTFHEYGLLKYFLPWLDMHWNSEACEYAMHLLAERNHRVQKGKYRESLSVATACLALPFIEEAQDQGPGALWEDDLHPKTDVWNKIEAVLTPHRFCQKVTASATSMILAMPEFLDVHNSSEELVHMRGYAHAREFFMIQNEVAWLIEDVEVRFPNPFQFKSNDQGFGGNFVQYKKKPKRNRKKGQYGKKAPRHQERFDDA